MNFRVLFSLLILSSMGSTAGCSRSVSTSKINSLTGENGTTPSPEQSFVPQSELLKKIIGNQEVKVGMDPTELPYCSKDENGKFIGFEVEINTLLVKEMSKIVGKTLKLEIIQADWNKIPSYLLANKFDVIGNAWTADEKFKDILWSKSYYDWGLVVGLHPDSKITSVEELKNKTIGRIDDPSTFEHINKMGFKKIKTFDVTQSAEDALLKTKKISAYIYDDTRLFYLRSKGTKIKFLKDRLKESAYQYGVREEDKELFDLIENALTKVKGSSEYKLVIKKWFKKD